MLEMVSTVVSLNSPRVSMARGRKEMPAAWHVAPWAANLRQNQKADEARTWFVQEAAWP